MSIPTITDGESITIITKCYVRKDFDKDVLGVLGRFYAKDNNGQDQKPKLSIFDGYSYDKMYINFKNEVKKISEDKIVSKIILDNLIRILKGYKGKKSPNKKKYVEDIINSIYALEENIRITNGFINMSQQDWEKLNTRDIVCYMKGLTNIDNIKSFKDALKKGAVALTKKPEAEVKAQHGVDLMTDYK